MGNTTTTPADLVSNLDDLIESYEVQIKVGRGTPAAEANVRELRALRARMYELFPETRPETPAYRVAAAEGLSHPVRGKREPDDPELSVVGRVVEEPLHVRVARALGCNTRDRGDGLMLCDCDGRRHGEGEPDEHGDRWPILRYDTDWSAIGPLIEEYEIGLRGGLLGAPEEHWAADAMFHAPTGLPEDAAYGGRWQNAKARGATALLAVCHLILKLGEAGKL